MSAAVRKKILAGTIHRAVSDEVDWALMRRVGYEPRVKPLSS